MLDPEAPDERRDEIAGNARERIEAAGSLRHNDTWGMRKLAYEIELRNEADYRYYRFEAESPLLDDLDHTLKITDGILRYRLFKVDPRAPLIEPPAGIQLGAPDRESRGRGGRRDDRRDDRGPRRDDRPAEAPAAESSPSAPEAPVAPETPAEPAEPAPEEAPAEEPAEQPAEDSAPAAEPAER